MNIAELQKKLIAAARTEVLDDRVPYAFEKRITALIASRVAPQNLDLWVRGLWRAAIVVRGGRNAVRRVDVFHAGYLVRLRRPFAKFGKHASGFR